MTDLFLQIQQVKRDLKSRDEELCLGKEELTQKDVDWNNTAEDEIAN